MDGMNFVEPIRSIPYQDWPGDAPHGLAWRFLLLAAIGLASLALIIGLDMAGVPLPTGIDFFG